MGGSGGTVSNCYANPYMFYVTATPYVQLPNGPEFERYGDFTQTHCHVLTLENASDEVIWNLAMCGPRVTLTNTDSENTTAINISSAASQGGLTRPGRKRCSRNRWAKLRGVSDIVLGVGRQVVMNGGSLTVVNAMRWGGASFSHVKGRLALYSRFEHGFSSGLHGDAIEESYVAEK